MKGELTSKDISMFFKASVHYITMTIPVVSLTSEICRLSNLRNLV